ncbi:hypothetical protein R1sor_009593 [Riccia sorocarpa]|uniref:RING-type E3 ubiquitin transferase n=1 Tax=Riccia sorocarpa TaxID=122646 RepID=A0ABD3HZ46_9MARC
MVGVDLPGVVALGQNLLDKLSEVSAAAQEVHWEKQNFQQLADFLREIVNVVVEINKTRDSSPVVLQVLESLYTEVENAEQLITICTSKSRIYLLTRCRVVVGQLEDITHGIGRTLSIIPLSAVQGHRAVKEQINRLAQDMQKARYFVQETEERICRTLEQVQDQDIIRTDIAVQTGIVMDIARTLGMEDLPRNPAALKDQIQLLRHDMQDTSQSYDLHMVDVIGNIFENVAQVNDHPSPSAEIQQRHNMRIEPLYEAFVCPLTKQVMVDPVTLENGQTYERSAIEKWFKVCREENRPVNCPMTGKVLESTALKPSISLRNTIEEWTNRNEFARIVNGRHILESNSSQEEDYLYALKDLQALCQRNKLNKYRIRNNDLIPLIVSLLKSMEQVRIRALILLRILAEDDDDNKEAIGHTDALRSILKCLSRTVSEERQEAASLLYELSKSDKLCERIGSTNGAILYLVGMTSSHSDNVVAVQKAEMTLENLENIDQNVRQMAESGRIQPLLRRLLDGSEDVRYEMASDLATIPLTAEVKQLVTVEAAHVLVGMLDDSHTQTREVALKAIRALSSSESNGKILIDAGILPPLMKDLFMVGTAVPMRMKEICAAILAHVVMSSGEWQTTPIDAEGNTLISETIVHNLLHLISNTGPNIEARLLQVLVGLASSTQSVASLVTYIKSAGAIVSLIQFLEAPQDQLRVPAVRLLYHLSTHMGHEVADGLRVTTRQLGTLVKMLGSNGLIEEQAAAAGLLANLPVDDFRLTRALLDEGALPILVKRIEDIRRNLVRIGAARYMNTYQEGLVTILTRFTYTLDDQDVVALARRHNLAVFSRTLLQVSSLDEVQHQSVLALENLSTFTPQCRPASPPPQPKGCGFLSCLRGPPRPSGLCPVHGMVCSASETFCLLEAQAVDPLVSCLDNQNVIIVEAALGALSTLLQDNVDMERGVEVLHKADAISPILDILQEHRTELLRQKSVWMLERILRNGDLARLIAADPHVHAALVDALRHGNAICRSLAEKSLKHLNKIPSFSGVFNLDNRAHQKRAAAAAAAARGP